MQAKILQLPKICDPRGNLSFVEGFSDIIPFPIERAYWLYEIPGGDHREGHAFRQQEEFIIALSGSFDVVLNDGGGETRYHMSRSYYGLYVPPMMWRRLDNFSTNSVVLVLSSTKYDPSDYIEDFGQYLREKASHSPAIAPHTAFAPQTPAGYGLSACREISLETHHHAMGNLSVIEGGRHTDFAIRRCYYLYDIPGGQERGGHSHKECATLIMAASGSFFVTLADGTQKRQVYLNRPNKGLLVAPGVWRTLSNFSSGSVALVLASERYSEDDYIRNYQKFLAHET